MLAIRRCFRRPFEWFDRVERKIDRLIEQGIATMGKLEDIVSQIDQETNDIAARIDALKGNVTDPATVTKLEAISARLKSLGSDPANPVPSPTDGGTTDPGTSPTT